MPSGGHNALTASQKKKRGTHQKCRDADKHIIAVDGDPPEMPEGFGPVFAVIWERELPRAMKAGVCSVDSAMFTDYVRLMSVAESIWFKCQEGDGAPPALDTLRELRMMRQQMGIAGPKSRLVRGKPDPKVNPFSTL